MKALKRRRRSGATIACGRALAMQLSERTVVVSEVPPEVCASGAADVQIATLFQPFGDVIAVCLHPQQHGAAGWATVTFAEPGEASQAVCAATITVEVAATRERGQRTAVLPVSRGTLAMESRAMAAVQLGGRGPAPVRRRGHTSFRTSSLRADERAPAPRGRASDAQFSERSAFLHGIIVAAFGEPRNATEQAAWGRAVDRLVTGAPPTLWSAMQTLQTPPEKRTQRDVSVLVSMARHQQIGFITKLTGPEQRRTCAVLRLLVVPAGHRVYTEGSAADAMYIIMHGAATATTRQGGGGNSRMAQLLLGQAESEEDSDEEEQNPGLSSAAFSAGAHGSAAAAGSRVPVPAVLETEERKLGDLEGGQHFGELALLKPGSVRTATVVAREPLILLQVNQVDFSSAMKLDDEEQAELKAQLSRLRQCPVFQDLPCRMLLDLAELAEYRCCPKGTVLYEQGAPATHMCLVLSGRVEFSANIRRRDAPTSRPSRPKAAASVPKRIDTSLFRTELSPASPETGSWHVTAGTLGAGAIVGSAGLPPDGEKSPRSGGTRHQAVQRHRWTTTATNDVEVLELRVHTLIHRTSPVVLERLYEYNCAELSRQSLERAAGQEHQWGQTRSELFVHITGKGQTQKQVEMQDMWASRAARASLAPAPFCTPRREDAPTTELTGLSLKTLSSLRKRSQSINSTGHRHKQEVRWLERLKDRTARMAELREEQRTDPALHKNALQTDWAQAHPDCVQTIALYDQLARKNWDPMTVAAAPSNLGKTSTAAILDGKVSMATQNRSGPSETKEILLRGIQINASLYSVAFEETLVLCGSVGCADLETQRSAGFSYVSWLYCVESLLERFEQHLKDDGMAEHFKLVRVGAEGFAVIATPAPAAAQCAGGPAAGNSDTINLDRNHSDLAGSAQTSSSVGSYVSVDSTSSASLGGDASKVQTSGVSLARIAKKLLEFGAWMLDEANALNEKADTIDRSLVNSNQIYAAVRPPSPTDGMVDTAVDSLHSVHSGRTGLLETHRVEMRIGIASGQCAAHALGVRRPVLFHLTGPVMDGAERLCSESEAGCMLMSPAVEELIGKSVGGLTRVSMKVDKIARTAEERAAMEADKELEEVVTAQRVLEQARQSGNLEAIREAEQQLAVEQAEADEAVRAAAAAVEHARAEREERRRALEAARIARIDAATGPKYYQVGWRNGRRNTDCLTPRQVSSVDARRRLMTHRLTESTQTSAEVRPSTAPEASGRHTMPQAITHCDPTPSHRQREQQIKATPPRTFRRKRPQSAHSRLGLTARSPARRIMARPASATPRRAVTETAKAPTASLTEAEQAKARRPVLESYAFSACA